MVTEEKDESKIRVLAAQGWIGIAVWMSFGLLVEGLIAFRSPVYLQDPVRRELFRLAHAHGTLLSLALLMFALYVERKFISPPKAGVYAFQIGAILMPAGFLLGGIWHYESDPGVMVFLAPIGGILVIFGTISAAISSIRK